MLLILFLFEFFYVVLDLYMDWNMFNMLFFIYIFIITQKNK